MGASVAEVIRLAGTESSRKFMRMEQRLARQAIALPPRVYIGFCDRSYEAFSSQVMGIRRISMGKAGCWPSASRSGLGSDPASRRSRTSGTSA